MEVVDRFYWERRSSPEAMTLFERFRSLLAERSIPLKWSFRQDGIALGGKWNFAYIIPQPSGHCLLRFYGRFYLRMPQEFLKEGREKLAQAAVFVEEMSDEQCSLSFDTSVLDRSTEIAVDLIRRAVNLQA
jgi:hypothetical protein